MRKLESQHVVPLRTVLERQFVRFLDERFHVRKRRRNVRHRSRDELRPSGRQLERIVLHDAFKRHDLRLDKRELHPAALG